MDTAYTIAPFLGFPPVNLREVLEGDHYPMSELRAISGHPDFVGFSERGASVTDRDTCVVKDLRLKTRVLLDSTFSENPYDHTQWLIPTVFYRGLSTFSITTKIAPAEVLDRCTAASDVPALITRTSSRQYSGSMWGGAIDIAAEAIQRSSDHALREIFALKEKQLRTSMEMTQKHVVYGHMMAAPTIKFVDMYNTPSDHVSKADMFHQVWKRDRDEFLSFNLRRTGTMATFVDLDNSLRYGSSFTACTPPDTILVHPALADQLPLHETIGGNSRQVYYACSTKDKKELDESDIRTLAGAEHEATSPPKVMLVNGAERYVMVMPESTLNDGNRRNLSELTANFKSYNVIGCNPQQRGRSKQPSFDRVTSVPWNEIRVTDLDVLTDGTIRMSDVMERSGYFKPETYDTSRYRRMFTDTPALHRIMDRMDQAEFDADCISGQNLGRRSCLLRPSRKVFYNPRKKKFFPAIAYGHSELPESPVDNGDVIAGMTMMARCLMSEEKFRSLYECAFQYLRGCLALKWTAETVKTYAAVRNVANAEAAAASVELLMADQRNNGGLTHFVRYRHLSTIKENLERQMAQQEQRDRQKVETAAALDSILSLVDLIIEKYKSLTRTNANFTHSWLFTNAGKASFRGETNDQDRELETKEIVFDRIVLRLLNPRIFVVADKKDKWRPEIIEKPVTFCQSLADHTNTKCNLVHNSDKRMTFVSTTSPSADCLGQTVHDVTRYFPYYSFAGPRGEPEPFVNRNYSYRADRVSSLPVSKGVGVFTLLFLSMLQNPTTTNVLVREGVYVNTAFLLFRTVEQRTCSAVMARSGANNRYLFLGNGKLDAIETNASSYKTSCRIEITYVDTSPMDNTRVQHYVAGLGYVRGMGCTIMNPSQQHQREGRGDFVAVPLPASFDPEAQEIMIVNGRASVADGNTNQSLDQPDEITGRFTTNPYATVGASEAHVTLALKHPLWMTDNVGGAGGVHRTYLLSRQPVEQYKSDLDQFYQPVFSHNLKEESNVAMQGRQYYDSSQCEPCAFKTVNKGFYGEHEHSSSAFRNLLDVSSFRTDQGMLIVDPTTCLPTGRGTDDQYIRTGLRKRYPPY